MTTKTSDKNYLAKDFDSFRNDLVTYARNYFVQQNADFSEASLGGMFVELAAYVGDSMAFFLDHQFNELDPLNASNAINVLQHARNAGVKAAGAAPAVVNLTIYIEVPATTEDGKYVPLPASLPVLEEGTVCGSTQGTKFTITEDVDFAQKDSDGNFYATVMTSQTDASGNPSYFIMTRDVIAVSGEIATQTVKFGVATPFKKITLTKSNVSEIISVKDTDNNEYYEVDFLTQDTVFKKSKNLTTEQLEVPSILEIVPATRRFTKFVDFNTATTTLTFGGGDGAAPDNDLIPDPSELALPLYGKKTFTRFSIDPRNMMKTQTLGLAPSNTVLTINYRFGGGLSHNVGARSINSFSRVKINFPGEPSAIISTNVVDSLDVVNNSPAAGGAPKQTLQELRTSIFSARNEQSRIVTQDDLLARLYSLPSTFGRVYRASIRKSSRNPLASELYVLCRNRNGQLTIAPDSLKKNLSTYLNEFRLISDAIDVLDTTIINFGIEFSIVVTPDANKNQVLTACASALANISGTSNYQIDQPLIEADFINAIINTNGVLSLTNLTFFNRSGTISGRDYSDYPFDLEANKYKGMIVGIPGSIFEMKFASSDIIGSAE